MDVFVPNGPSYKLKAKGIHMEVNQPILPCTLFSKTKMSAKLAKDVQFIDGVRRFLANDHGFVEPLTDEDAAEVEAMKVKPPPSFPVHLLGIQLNGYVKVIDGEYKDRYGIVIGLENERFKVSKVFICSLFFR